MCFVGTITPSNTLFVGTITILVGTITIKLSRFYEKFLCGVEEAV